MGKIDPDQLLTILLLNALGSHYSRLQTSINNLLQNLLTTSRDVRNHLLIEERTILLHNKQGTENIALAAVAKPTRPVCSNCKHLTHCTEYCISAGGQMAGKTIEEARAAQDAARTTQKPTGTTARTRNSHTTTTTGDNTKSIVLDSKLSRFCLAPHVNRRTKTRLWP
jgi:hypothetical protein